jgi:membrane protein DedA with SNARE-associated domain
MHNYILIFLNSLQASLILSVRTEYGWFAALAFGNYDMRLATIMAFLGATLGDGIDFAIGYVITILRSRYVPLRIFAVMYCYCYCFPGCHLPVYLLWLPAYFACRPCLPCW